MQVLSPYNTHSLLHATNFLPDSSLSSESLVVVMMGGKYWYKICLTLEEIVGGIEFLVKTKNFTFNSDYLEKFCTCAILKNRLSQ